MVADVVGREVVGTVVEAKVCSTGEHVEVDRTLE